MKTPTRLLLSLAVLAGLALPPHAQHAAAHPGADPALTQQADPALVKMVPAGMAGKHFTVAVALGSPPDVFRNRKGAWVGAAGGQMGVTVVREKVVDMIGTLTSNELFAAYADSPIMVKTLDDLCGVTGATTRGSREMVFAEGHQPKCAAA